MEQRPHGACPSTQKQAGMTLAAGVILSRSVEFHKLQYVTMLCDGDSKAYNHVAALQLYDKDVSKECMNHVAQRLYAGMEKLKKAKKGLGG